MPSAKTFITVSGLTESKGFGVPVATLISMWLQNSSLVISTTPLFHTKLTMYEGCFRTLFHKRPYLAYNRLFFLFSVAISIPLFLTTNE